MWTGNYNEELHALRLDFTLAGSMWTGNYNAFLAVVCVHLTLAGSMWTGNYNLTAHCNQPGRL